MPSQTWKKDQSYRSGDHCPYAHTLAVASGGDNEKSRCRSPAVMKKKEKKKEGQQADDEKNQWQCVMRCVWVSRFARKAV